MLLQQIALVSESASIGYDQVGRVSAALQKQVSRDFTPIWKIEATVDAFAKLEDVPLGYWRIILQDDIDTPGVAGVHEGSNGQPFSLVQAADDWSLTASHECLEMLVDPFGQRLVAGPSLQPGQGRVEYLVEVCDPCENPACAYQVNGVTVSDFYTPNYFDPVIAPGVRYSFSGMISAPRQVLPGGYLTWHDPMSDHWFQLINFQGAQLRDLGIAGRINGNIRSFVDRLTPTPLEVASLSNWRGSTDLVAGAPEVRDDMVRLSIASNAHVLRKEILRVKAENSGSTARR